MKASIASLEAWYKTHHRALPWRRSQDPYAIWVSEVMLQQTQVTTVVPYFLRFLKHFPTVQALANAKESDVLSLWSGLGYYSRARNLHKGAKYLLKNENGEFPKTREACLKIPGIGPYTAGAILSIAYDLPEPIVDGNVFRVFSRYFGFRDCIDIPKNHHFFWDNARQWAEAADSPRILNQAVMELGATVCTKASPRCDQCPLIRTCFARKKNLQEILPVRKKRKTQVELKWHVSVYEKNGKVFLVRNAKDTWWAGLWDLPHQTEPLNGTLFSRHSHTVTHHKITALAYLDSKNRPSKKLKGRWFPLEAALEAPISSLSRKILTSLET